jgi:hypothetical protein
VPEDLRESIPPICEHLPATHAAVDDCRVSSWAIVFTAHERVIGDVLAQPTTRRENKSSKTAKYSQPSSVAMNVTSPTQVRFGASTVKQRSGTSGAIGMRLQRPRKPFSRDRAARPDRRPQSPGWPLAT